MGEHTPGPWRVRDKEPRRLSFEGDPRFWVLVNGEGFSPAICPAWDRPEKPDEFAGPEAEANARLIAAAPDLLAALEECVKRIRDPLGEWDHIGIAAEQAERAIAKAKGPTHES